MLSAALAATAGAELNVISMVPLSVQLRRMSATPKAHRRNWLFVEAQLCPQMSIFATVSRPSNIKKVEAAGVDLVPNG
jgi:hypothetical protein